MKILRSVVEMEHIDGIYITVSQHMFKLGSKRIQKEFPEEKNFGFRDR